MPSFLEDYSAFYGDGSKNEDGLTLDEFLDSYDPAKYRNPSVTADVMIFRYYKELQSVAEDLSILMIKRRNHPCIGYWALPGGFCEVGEDIEEAARRELKEETHLTGIPISQLRTWGETWRDPRDRIITTAFAAVVDESVHEPVAGDDASEALWFDIEFRKLSSEIIYQEKMEIVKCTYGLYLYNKEHNIKCDACVSVKENLYGFLKEMKYDIIYSNNIAFDHARFIVNALLEIQDSLNCAKKQM